MALRDINEEIIEDLYSKALVLADDARAAFDMKYRDTGSETADLTCIALSIEGLRTTTRLMHILAWLLNQRAYFSGELSLSQLERCGALPEERPADRKNLAQLEPETRELIAESERLHARVARLDRDWRSQTNDLAVVVSLQNRIAQAFATG